MIEDFLKVAAANWQDMTHYQRIEFYRSLRLFIIEEKKREGRKHALRAYLFEKWLNENTDPANLH